jgi:hypothetical protein
MVRQPARRERERTASADRPSTEPACAKVSHWLVGRVVDHAVGKAVGDSVGRSAMAVSAFGRPGYTPDPRRTKPEAAPSLKMRSVVA